MRRVLLDVTPLCAHHTDAALELFHKAAAEPPDDGIWDVHPSPFIRQLVELFTERGLARSEGLRAELDAWLSGSLHRGDLARVPRPPGAMQRWSPAELHLARLYLESLPPGEFRLDDWMMVVDYVTQRYLPADDLRTEADWLATRSGMMGRIEAGLDSQGIAGSSLERVLDALPATSGEGAALIGLTENQMTLLEYGSTRAAENVATLSDSVRHRLRRVVADWQETAVLGQPGVAREALQTRLLDTFGAMNRDWRRIAVTEATEAMDQGFVAGLAPGSRVRRVEKYRGACAFCRAIDGTIMTVVAASAPDKDGATQIWPGKTNVGRSAAPRRREGNALVDREPHELWWIASGVQHPHCRGSWVHIQESTRPVDPKFSAWMDQVLGR